MSTTRSINTSVSAPAGFSAPAPLVAVAQWILPGAGYFLVGEAVRGIVIGVTILAMFVFGLLLGGVRVIDVPGYDDLGYRVLYSGDRKLTHLDQIRGASGTWVLTMRPISEIINKPWIVPQLVVGPAALIAAHYSLEVSHPENEERGSVPAVPRTHGRLAEIGTLYTAIAGMLNLLAMIDSASRAGARSRGEQGDET